MATYCKSDALALGQVIVSIGTWNSKSANNMESPSACQINSFVFFDIHLEKSGRPDPHDIFTEICLLSVHRSAIEDDRVSVSPRVMDKLVLCCHGRGDPCKRPRKRPRVDPVQEVTSNPNMMSGLKSHKNITRMILCFLQRQHTPVCLLAHNGHRVDFRLLRGMSGFCAYPEGLRALIRCADTSNAFRAIKPYLPSHISLSNLYLKEFGGPIKDAHHAEGDTMALMQLFLQDGEKMMRWCDKYSTPF